MPYALLLFIAMPIIEIALLLRVGEAFGWLPTLLIVIATAIIGSAMLRQQGLATLNKARQRMDSGELPAQQLLEGVLIMIGGVLLLTPGFVTDAFGFVCLIPVTRQWLAARMSATAVVGFSSTRGSGASANGRFRGPFGGPINDQASGDKGGMGGDASGRSATASPSSRQRGDSTGDIIDGDFKRIDDD